MPPLIVIQIQMREKCNDWNIPCVDMAETGIDAFEETFRERQPKIILCSIESLNNPYF